MKKAFCWRSEHCPCINILLLIPSVCEVPNQFSCSDLYWLSVWFSFCHFLFVLSLFQSTELQRWNRETCNILVHPSCLERFSVSSMALKHRIREEKEGLPNCWSNLSILWICKPLLSYSVGYVMFCLLAQIFPGNSKQLSI